MGMSSSEWSRYMHSELGVPMEPDEISAAVVERLKARYRRHVPLLPHAVETVRSLAERWPLALASSANRPLIDFVLELTEMAGLFRATVSSEEVPRGKPAPDVYLEAARRLEVAPKRCVAIEDSTNGIQLRARRGHAGDRGPAPELPALRRGAATRRRSARLAGRARSHFGRARLRRRPGYDQNSSQA